ncbi:MAG: hypothetical protein ACREPY_04745 [Rhodanobacteraceae bacterium]
MGSRCWLTTTLLVLSTMAVAGGASTVPTGLQRGVVFTRYPSIADNAQLLRRLVSPLNAYRIEQRLGGNALTLRAHPLDPAKQRFAMYVPSGPAPPSGYALLVFVPPWDDARVPQQWIPALDRHHMIFISAAHSGNDANVLERREPLTLLAEYNITKRYRIDPARVYVGGFSGGSRVALRLALGYPDVFRGALLDAGSDPIGTVQVPLPPSGLLHRFQQTTRIVSLTGNRDYIRQAMAARTRESLQRWCVFDRDSVTMPFVGHALAGADAFDRALDALAHTEPPDATRLAGCRAHNTRALDVRLAQVQASLGQGKWDKARKLLDGVDAQFGGLAAPRSVDLMRKLDFRVK